MDLVGFKNARLIFDEPRAIFYAGQMISGHIECVLNEPTNYAAIYVTYYGEGRVYWTETEVNESYGNRRSVEVEYKAKEEYFNATQCISVGNGPVSLSPGTHKIPFQYLIPETAPSSFRGERGEISYTIRVYMDNNAGVDRIQIEKAFEVVAPLDLNKLGGDVKQPINMEFEECYGGCCGPYPLNIVVKLPASGFCPGQIIPITVVARNETQVEIKKIIFQLTKKECYHSLEPPSDFVPPEEVLETVKTGPILSNTKRELTYELVVPAMIVPNLDNCSIIDVGYFLKVMIRMSGCYDDLEEEEEICLGLVPLSSLIGDEPYIHPMQSDLPRAPLPSLGSIPVHTETVQNMSYPPMESSTTAYPNSAPYPTSCPYSPNSQIQTGQSGGEQIPLGTLRSNNIGFVIPPCAPNQPNYNSPYPGNISNNQVNPPYPGIVSNNQGNPPYPGNIGINQGNPPYPGNIGTNQGNPPYPGNIGSNQGNPPYPGNIGNNQGNPPYPENIGNIQGNPPYPAYTAPSAPPPS
ncbi:arrestin domain-containing protein 1-like isoform X2 [Pectinophora gossypiella]|uniref:arrestin domain-containing protein 1-like isoform X2 n=1 Tax=Pectinophora gossypiella TaxID=13191 RepID=UPI00214F162A|nr:arrestin domain-containing protein 1-like isoform X2 [Pectinophora gossypiella]